LLTKGRTAEVFLQRDVSPLCLTKDTYRAISSFSHPRHDLRHAAGIEHYIGPTGGPQQLLIVQASTTELFVWDSLRRAYDDVAAGTGGGGDGGDNGSGDGNGGGNGGANVGDNGDNNGGGGGDVEGTEHRGDKNGQVEGDGGNQGGGLEEGKEKHSAGEAEVRGEMAVDKEINQGQSQAGQEG
jgi:hypothetical protein